MKTSSTGKCVIASLNLRDLNICIFHWRYACQKSTSPSFVILLNLTNKMFLSIYLFCLNLSLSFSVDSLHLSRSEPSTWDWSDTKYCFCKFQLASKLLPALLSIRFVYHPRHNVHSERCAVSLLVTPRAPKRPPVWRSRCVLPVSDVIGFLV